MSYSHLRKFITLQQRALRLKEGQGKHTFGMNLSKSLNCEG